MGIIAGGWPHRRSARRRPGHGQIIVGLLGTTSLAGHQGRAVADAVEAARRNDIEAEAITDLEPSDVAAAQMELLQELSHIEAVDVTEQNFGGAAARPRPA